MQQEKLESLYKRYEDSNVVLASEQLARWTIPSVMLKYNTVQDGKRVLMERDYQSKGARLVNSLASKIVQSLIPDNTPFFSIKLDDALQGEVQSGLNISSDQYESQLIQWAADASARAITGTSYSKYSHLAKLLVITGNALLYRDPSNYDTSVYSLRQYVVNRDGYGNVTCIIIKERVQVQDLPESLRASQFKDKPEWENLTLYTQVRLNKQKNVWEVTQEVQGITLDDVSTYPKNLCPYIVCTANLNTGEHYGRGIVEDYAPDFARLSELSTALQMYEIESLRLLNFVASQTGLDIQQLDDAAVGEYLQAEKDGIFAHEGGTSQKMQVIQAEIQSIFQELSQAFMYTGNFRQAERVTAEEIRAVIQETNVGHLSVFSHISETFLKPLAHLLLFEVEPKLNLILLNNQAQLQLQVGASVVNKSVQVDRLLQATLSIQQILPVLAQVSPRFNQDAVIDKIMQGFSIDVSEITYTPEQLKQRQEQAALEAQQQQAQSGMSDPNLVAQMTGAL